MYESCAELAAKIGPELAALLHARAPEIETEVHPALARWAVKHVLVAVERHLPAMADYCIGSLCNRFKDVTMGEMARYIDNLIMTSDFQPIAPRLSGPDETDD